MVSHRCKLIVKEEFLKLGLIPVDISLGEVEILVPVPEHKLSKLKAALLLSGLELMDNKKAILIERIKTVILEMVHYSDEVPKINFSNYLCEKLDYDYTYMANLFSEVAGTTIEQFIILHKIERVKELILYNELNLTEIA